MRKEKFEMPLYVVFIMTHNAMTDYRSIAHLSVVSYFHAEAAGLKNQCLAPSRTKFNCFLPIQAKTKISKIFSPAFGGNKIFYLFSAFNNF